MKDTITGLILSFLSILLTTHPVLSDDDDVSDLIRKGYAPGELIVKLKSGRMKITLEAQERWESLRRRFGIEDEEEMFPPRGRAGARGKVVARDELSSIYKLRLDMSADVERAAIEYEGEAFVEYAQPNYLNRYSAEPDDPHYKEQWALRRISWERALERADPSREVIIAIVDSGIDYKHEDLADNIWINSAEMEGTEGIDDDGNGYVDDILGWDFTDAPTLPGMGDYLVRDSDPMDESGHGTHVAGVIGAIAGNGVGVAGICPNSKLMPLRAGLNLPTGGVLEDDDVASAIVYAADNGAHVINMSWGDPRLSPLMRDVIRYAYERGCVLVAAVGNESFESLFFPARFEQTIAVGATDDRDKLALFSNFGRNLDVVAPGVGILSTDLGGGYKVLSGTSMASACAAGLAGLILSRNPDFSPEEVRSAIISSAWDIYDPGWDRFSGAGRIDALGALSVDLTSVVQIIEPESGWGTDSTFAVIGNVIGSDVRSYEVSWGQGTAPRLWNTLSRAEGSPALRDTLARWDASALRDGQYAIRLLVIKDDLSTVEDRVVVYVDHTEPEIRAIRIAERLDGPGFAHFIEWETDDITLGRVVLRPSGSPEAEMDSDFQADFHSIRIPTEFPPKEYEFHIAARNTSDLVSQSPDSSFSVTDGVSQDGFSEVGSLPNGYLMGRISDFDHDGRNEIALMPYADGRYNVTEIYERQDDGGLKKVFSSTNLFLPWNISDLDGDGKLELMGVDAARLRLFESPDKNSFPSVKIWEAGETWGGEVADLDNDGKQEIIARSNLREALVVFESDGDDSFSEVASLPNPTQGDNNIGPRSVIADFDGDGSFEIVSGDSDGDVYIYEAMGDDTFRWTWTERREGADAGYLTGGSDLDSDGRIEFVVGYTMTDPLDPRGARWIISVYQSIGDDTYEIEWEMEIIGVEKSGNGMATGDLDGDGKDELAVCAMPDIYIFDSDGVDSYKPTWHTFADLTYLPVIGDLDSDGLSEIIFNKDGAVKIYEMVPPSGGPSAPNWVLATPLDSNSVEITWSGEGGLYRLYRGTEPDFLEVLADKISSSSYVDRDLIAEVTYFYAVSSLDPIAVPGESRLSKVVDATPSVPPRLLRAQALSQKHVEAIFNEPLGPSAKIPAHYWVSPMLQEAGRPLSLLPTSAILDRGGLRVILGFERDLAPSSDYLLTVEGVRDTSGVLISPEGNKAMFSVPEKGSFAQIVSVRALSPVEIELVFSNEIIPSSNISSAYSISHGVVVRSVDVDPADAKVVHLLLDERTPLRALGRKYEVSVKGVRDISGAPVVDSISLKLAKDDLKDVIVFPNPFRLTDSKTGRITFGNLTPEATVRIYSPEGVLVRTLMEDDGDGGVVWDGRNEEGQKVGSGIYLYLVESGEMRKMGKFAVVRRKR